MNSIDAVDVNDVIEVKEEDVEVVEQKVVTEKEKKIEITNNRFEHCLQMQTELTEAVRSLKDGEVKIFKPFEDRELRVFKNDLGTEDEPTYSVFKKVKNYYGDDLYFDVDHDYKFKHVIGAILRDYLC